MAKSAMDQPAAPVGFQQDQLGVLSAHFDNGPDLRMERFDRPGLGNDFINKGDPEHFRHHFTGGTGKGQRSDLLLRDIPETILSKRLRRFPAAALWSGGNLPLKFLLIR